MNPKMPYLTFIYDRYHKSNINKQSAVELRITYEGKQKYISTGIMLFPNQWKNGIIINSPDSIILNKTLDKILNDVRKVIYDMLEEGCIDIYSIPARLKAVDNTKISLIDFCIQRAEVRKYGKAKDTQERYDRFIKSFKQYGKIRNFADINDNSIIEYDKYLAKKHLTPYSKWNNYHRFLNSFILDAIDDGLMVRNPYRWITINKDKNSRGIDKYLTPEEFYKIKKVHLPTDSLNRIRDLFVFQTYTCLSYRDLKAFDLTGIKDIDGIKTYLGDRTKTHVDFTVPMFNEALAILHKYNNVLPIISNVKYNAYLKIIAQAAGIDRPVATHWARHTGATLLLNEGVDLHVVSKVLGHSSIKITERIYAKLLNKTIVKAVTNVMDNI